MPSGRTHDAITIVTAIPAFAAAYLVAGDINTSIAVTTSYLFGGLMFGPDLDTVSRQYSRWAIFKFLWLPYRRFFRHRSRFSHGLVLGAFLRVVCLAGVISLCGFACVYAFAAYTNGAIPAVNDLVTVWRSVSRSVTDTFGRNIFFVVFLGLWLGAASHTFTDLTASYIRTGRVTDLL